MTAAEFAVVVCGGPASSHLFRYSPLQRYPTGQGPARDFDRRAVAVHESAHIVLARFFGLPIYSATIKPEPGMLGHVALVPNPSPKPGPVVSDRRKALQLLWSASPQADWKTLRRLYKEVYALALKLLLQEIEQVWHFADELEAHGTLTFEP